MSDRRYVAPPFWMPAAAHGTRHGYDYYACRCRKCRRANTESAMAGQARRAARPMPPTVVHGSANAYDNYLCRCQPCRAGNAARSKVKRARARARREAAGANLGAPS
jgi:hypothetical protein